MYPISTPVMMFSIITEILLCNLSDLFNQEGIDIASVCVKF